MNKFHSIIRQREYEEISKLEINGKILDLGGSTKSGYHELIRGSHTFTTVNIDRSFGCDMVFDIQEKFPLPDNEYDAVISINVFEHVFGFQNAFPEARRILKRDGLFFIAVPFIHPVHGSPDDFFRFTESSLKKLLEDQNFEIIYIKPLGYGIFSLFFQLVGGIFPGCFRSALKSTCISVDKILLKFSGKYRGLAKKIPLGYAALARAK
jgi:SAM-dependent methyltransferase